MRRIKFRAWDERQQRMIRPELLDIHGDWYASTSHFLEADVGQGPLMQFAGLYDKNRKEIYEGDIVMGSHTYMYYPTAKVGPCVIRRSEYGFSIDILASLQQVSSAYFDDHSLEVIGNIYENPELVAPIIEKTNEQFGQL